MPHASGVANYGALEAWQEANPYTRIISISDTGSGISFTYDKLPQPDPSKNWSMRDIVSTESTINKPSGVS